MSEPIAKMDDFKSIWSMMKSAHSGQPVIFAQVSWPPLKLLPNKGIEQVACSVWEECWHSGLGNLNPFGYVRPQKSAFGALVAHPLCSVMHEEVAASLVGNRAKLALGAQVAV